MKANRVRKSPFPKIAFYREPLLEFGMGQTLEYPRDGLFLYGPVDASAEVEAIRYGVIGTPEGVRRLKIWAKSLHGFIDIPPPGLRSRNIEPQHVPFPGFQEAFGAKWPIKPAVVVDNLTEEGIQRALRIENRHEAVQSAVSLYVDRIVKEHDRQENPPAFWFVVIPEIVYALGRSRSVVAKQDRVPGTVTMSPKRASEFSIQPTFFEEDERQAGVYKYATNFRRQLKARLLSKRVVTQIVRETTLTPNEFKKENGMPLRAVEDPATIAWKLGTGAYYKAGGKPWQIAHVRPGVCYVGLVYKKSQLVADDRDACCAAQMFLSDGEGVVFRGALGPWYHPDTKQYHIDRESARALLEMVVGEYRSIHKTMPSELFVHAPSSFTNEEWQGFEQACPKGTKLVGVQISDARENLKLFRASEYPVIRGTALLTSENHAYLWTTGYSARLDTYMGPETPNPISVRVVRGRFPLDQVLQDVMALTKINFNTCLMNDRMPVTIRFANAVGDVLIAAPIEGEPKLPFKYYI